MPTLSCFAASAFSLSREEDPDDVPHGHITSLVCKLHPGSLVGVEVGLVEAAPKVPVLHPLSALLLPGCEAFPPAPWSGSETDGPGLSSHDRELQCQIRLPARQEEVEAGLREGGLRGRDTALMGVLGYLGFW